ncbi:cell division ATP-binding protein FtsE [Halorhodospira halochloris]|uniref:Cell division ATP-binding protein FtsE n=1 Tax=Halorhodospira halochloris TaxID=1052 RepID=A0A0X8X764_HALHR|nr:cell division ATP-binding protein FtsE [Halorhodospira halochloris]MBK1650686.1 cell division ATP-binding protein FtsE [Halorhodospira halochloris]MCG5529795.1 cell division ATP-binding protein FtsE [Halorhodospira halochloris]MCG5548964.1 cell division ATP-binding protein FtsE [Halorhodospira halochloris]BAU56826.1 cell division transporter [Halorhodospira halochloris]
MIHFDRVSKRYRAGADGLRGVTLNIDEGEMVFVTGHSGAGKSTLLRLIPRLERPSGGRLVVAGVDVNALARRKVPLLRQRIGVTFQDHRLLADRNVFENVALPLVIAGIPVRERSRRVQAALDKVGLLNKLSALPQTLSGGEQQRVGIARAVVNRPPVLLADEPTGNLDPGLSAEIMKLFAGFKELGTTVLIATHDLNLVDSLGYRTISLSNGELADDRPANRGEL